MLVDYEKSYRDLLEHIGTKPHHGSRDLLAEAALIEISNRIEEGLPEKALRLHGVLLSEELLRPYPAARRVESPDGRDEPTPVPGDDPRPQEGISCQKQTPRPRPLSRVP